MIRFLKALVLLPVAVAVLLLAVANRAPVTFSLDPFARGAPDLSVSVPLYALLFGAVALGVLIGGIGSWVSGSGARRSGRAARREARRLKAEAARPQASARAAPPRVPGLPAPRGVA